MTDNLAEKSPTKKIYRSPELRVYGDIHRMTQTDPKGVNSLDSIHGSTKT